MGDGKAKTNLLPWIVGLVVGGLITSAVVFRVYLNVSDRHPAYAATPDPVVTAVPVATSTPTQSPTQTSATAFAPTPTPSSAPTFDPQEHARLVADAKRSVEIDLYGESWCPRCREAKSFLDRENISYTYRDTKDDVNKHTMRALNPASTIPTIKIDDELLIGFSEASMRWHIERAAEKRVAKRLR